MKYRFVVLCNSVMIVAPWNEDNVRPNLHDIDWDADKADSPEYVQAYVRNMYIHAEVLVLWNVPRQYFFPVGDGSGLVWWVESVPASEHPC